MQLTTLLAAGAVLAGTAQAHVRLTAFNGNSACVRLPPNNSPVESVTSNNIICNVNGNVPASSVCSVAAGATVTTKWDTGAHPGPEIVYMAKVSDAKTTTITGLNWFKVYQSGLSGSRWAADDVNSNGGNLSFRIPSSISAGQYLLRGETIGLHVAGSYPGAQFYMSCVQLQVTGGGSSNPGGISFPGTYKGSDSGITINIYYPPLSGYTIPGGNSVIS